MEKELKKEKKIEHELTEEEKEKEKERRRKEEEIRAKKEEKRKELAKEEKEKEKEKEAARAGTVVRILGTDIPGEKSILYGLTRIKGVSFAFSNAVCKALGIEKERKIYSLTGEEIEKIAFFISKPSLPSFMLNRRRDIESGEDRHLVSTELELQRDFDIRRLKKIRSYRGWRHALGLPVRGQRTRSHFRHGRAVGVLKAKAEVAEAERRGEKERKVKVKKEKEGKDEEAA